MIKNLKTVFTCLQSNSPSLSTAPASRARILQALATTPKLQNTQYLANRVIESYTTKPRELEQIESLFSNANFAEINPTVQKSILRAVLRNPGSLEQILGLMDDPVFIEMGAPAQSGAINILTHLNWNQLKISLTEEEQELLLVPFHSYTLKHASTQKELKERIKTKDFSNIQALILKDQQLTFDTNTFPNYIGVLQELKLELEGDVAALAIVDECDDDSLTLSESQLKLLAGSHYKKRSEFNTRSEYLEHNTHTFIKYKWSTLGLMLGIPTGIIISQLSLWTDSILAPFIPNCPSLLIYSVVFCIYTYFLESYVTSLVSNIPYPFFLESRYGNFKKHISHIIGRERMRPNSHAMYHAANSAYGTAYSAYSLMHGALNLNPMLSHNRVTHLRPFNDIYDEANNPEKLKGHTELMWKNTPRTSKRWYDHALHFRARAVSCNTGLLGNYQNPGECTMYYWQKNFSISSTDIEATFKDILVQLWGPRHDAKELNVRSNKYYYLVKKIATLTGGSLLQILADKDHIDDIAFITEAGGRSLRIKANDGSPETDKASVLLGLQREAPQEYEKILKRNKSSFKKPRLVHGNSFTYSVTQQARVIANPTTIADPKKALITKYDLKDQPNNTSDKANQKRKEVKELYEELNTMLRKDIVKGLAAGHKIPAGLATPNGASTLSIERLYKMMSKGFLNRSISHFTPDQIHVQKRASLVDAVIHATGLDDKELLDKSLRKLAAHESPKSVPNIYAKKKVHNFDTHAFLSNKELKGQLQAEGLLHDGLVTILQGFPELKHLLSSYCNNGWSTPSVHSERIFKKLESLSHLIEPLQKMLPEAIETPALNLLTLVALFKSMGQSQPKGQEIAFSVSLLTRYMTKIGFSRSEVILAVNLLASDTLDGYVIGKYDAIEQSRAVTEQNLTAHAESCKVDFKPYFALQYILLAASKSSYKEAAKDFKPEPRLSNLPLPELRPDLYYWIFEQFPVRFPKEKQ